jgi:hypothetical protein
MTMYATSTAIQHPQLPSSLRISMYWAISDTTVVAASGNGSASDTAAIAHNPQGRRHADRQQDQRLARTGAGHRQRARPVPPRSHQYQPATPSPM